MDIIFGRESTTNAPRKRTATQTPPNGGSQQSDAGNGQPQNKTETTTTAPSARHSSKGKYSKQTSLESIAVQLASPTIMYAVQQTGLKPFRIDNTIM